MFIKRIMGNEIDLKECLNEFLKQPEIKLLSMYRKFKSTNNIEQYLTESEQHISLTMSINESEETSADIDYDNVRVYDPEIVVKALKELCVDNDKWVEIKTYENQVKIIAIVPELYNNVRRVSEIMKTAGWFHSSNRQEIVNGLSWFTMQFEPYRSINIAGEIYSYAYDIMHATPTKNIPSIMKDGIKPSSKNMRYNYPPRLYFMFTDQNKAEISKYKVQHFVNTLSEASGIKDYSLIMIDV